MVSLLHLTMEEIMKQRTYFKKAVAILLASVMIFLMIPFSVLPIAAADSITSGTWGDLSWTLDKSVALASVAER